MLNESYRDIAATRAGGIALPSQGLRRQVCLLLWQVQTSTCLLPALRKGSAKLSGYRSSVREPGRYARLFILVATIRPATHR
jgi:hypothetical protein